MVEPLTLLDKVMVNLSLYIKQSPHRESKVTLLHLFTNLYHRDISPRRGTSTGVFHGDLFWRQQVLQYFNIAGQYVLKYLHMVPKHVKIENGGQRVLIR